MKRLINYIIYFPFIFSSVLAETHFIEPLNNSKNNSSSIKKDFIWEPINSNQSPSIKKDIIWEPINSNQSPSTSEKEWKKIDNFNELIFEQDKSKTTKMERNLKLMYEKHLDFELLELGNSVPTANTLEEGQLRFRIGQVSPIKNGYSSGTGNQNYLGEFEYGLHDNLLINIFYSDADDPLNNRIKNLATQPENRWSNYGTSIKWSFINQDQYKVAIDGSLENWLVQSGGCAGKDCSYNSSNIFNSNKKMVENNNLIGSISIPLTFNYTKDLELTLAPRFIFLPNSQGNEYGDGDFYGNNLGIGLGSSYKINNKTKSFASYYIPLGDSKNKFNDNLEFSKSQVFTLGINYSLDTNIAFEGYLSNGFGLTPSTSILTIPSSDNTLYGINLVYTPTNYDVYDLKTAKEQEGYKNINGLSVSSTNILKKSEYYIKYLIDGKGSWLSRLDIGLSELFSVDISGGMLSSHTNTDSKFKGYLAQNNLILRGGGTANIFSQSKGDAISTSIRTSVGRVLGEQKPGYFFAELINSYKPNNDLIFNLNPKFADSGSGNPFGVGTSINWQVSKNFSLIPETNIGISEAESNWTLALRYKPSDTKNIDVYTTNSYSFMDMGQLMKSNSQTIGISIGSKF